VGSEMCIRDRRLGSRGVPPDGALGKRRRRRRAGCDGCGYDAGALHNSPFDLPD